MGPSIFQDLVAKRDPDAEDVYTGILNHVESRASGLPGWSVVKLKKTIFDDCEYVYNLSTSAGSLASSGWGKQPVLDSAGMQQVFR